MGENRSNQFRKPNILLHAALLCLLTLCIYLVRGAIPLYASSVRNDEPKMQTEQESEILYDKPESDRTQEEEPLDVMVLSDLHFTLSKSVSNLIVPGMALCEELTDAFFDEVIERSPDVFIMTGDNTNGGYREDSRELARRLAKIRDAGIRIILTTGNHDLNNSTPEEFEEDYYGLVQIDDCDDASLSYVSVVKDTAFFAMDDNAVHPGGNGAFSDETMKWLERMLEKYAGYHILFLSHHNVLAGKGAFDSSSYRIQREELPAILESHGVRLILTGHLHAQMLTREIGTYEIISTMPLAFGHRFGSLQIYPTRLTYRLMEFDIERFAGKDLAKQLEQIEQENLQLQKDAFAVYLEKKGYSAKLQEEVPRLLMQFLGWYSLGELAAHEREVLEDPFYEDMIETMWDGNYGPWIVSVMENIPMDATWLDLEWD